MTLCTVKQYRMLHTNDGSHKLSKKLPLSTLTKKATSQSRSP
jgi:hypothetical protein